MTDIFQAGTTILFLVCLPSINDEVTGETNDIQTTIADIFHYAA